MPSPDRIAQTSRLLPKRPVVRARLALAAALLATAPFSGGISTGYAARPAPAPVPSPFSYADVADLVTHADIIAVARPRSLAKIDAAAMASPPGMQRYYVEADVSALIRGDAGLPTRIAFLLDLPATARPSSVKGKSLILFGKAGARPGEFQLLSSDTMLPWTPATEAKVRGIATEVIAPDAPPEITRVVEAFHVEGTVAGESETQVFLTARGGRPLSLSIVRRPNEEPRYGAALGEIVDEAASLPQPDTLLWYRLACGLPPALPMTAAMKLDANGAEAAAGDYRSFMAKMASCARTRAPFPATQGPAPQLGNGGGPR